MGDGLCTEESRSVGFANKYEWRTPGGTQRTGGVGGVAECVDCLDADKTDDKNTIMPQDL